MKVLHLVHWEKSGIYVAVKALKAEGQKHGDTHDIITLRKDSSLSSGLMSIFLFVVFIFRANFSGYDRINLHSFLPYMGNFFCLLSKSTLFFHSNYPFLRGKTFKDKIKLSLIRISNRHNRPAAVSSVVKQSVDSALGADCKIVYNIIKFHENKNHTRRVIQVGAAGRFDPEKRFFELAESFVISGSNCTLHLAGDGRLLEKVVSYVTQKDCKRIVFHGRKSSMEDFYEMIDAYICCSEFEGFGLVIAEAMLHGKIIISTKVGILCEDFKFKFLELNFDLSNLTEKILLAEKMDSDTIFEMIDTNRKLLAENFTDLSTYKVYRQHQLGIE